MRAAPSVVIDNFDFGGAFSGPDEAQSELIIDADAVLAAPVPVQRLQAIGRRYAQIPQIGRNVEHRQLAQGSGFDVAPPRHALAIEQRLRAFAGERLDRQGSNGCR